MASVVTTKSGREKGLKRISFIGLDKRRREIRVGRISQTKAQIICGHIETLLQSVRVGLRTPERTTAEWLGQLPDAFFEKLVRFGLVLPREAVAEPETPTVGKLIDQYISRRGKVKESTEQVWRRVQKHLIEYFGGRPIGSITTGDAEDWSNHLASREENPLSDATVRRHCGMARQFFGYAVRHKLIAENPFASKEIKTTVRGNAAKFHFVTAEDAAKILEACPSREWRVIFALSRWGGLRCPSEHLALKWGHVDWEHGRLIVPSPKTAHHEGREQRIMPLFPELRKELEALFAEADPGEWIITRYRNAGQNLRTTFEKIVLRAGLKPWPKLFHNLRATRQTELADRFPAHVVSEWIGNSEAVAREHYLRTTDAHFDRASQEAGSAPTFASQSSVVRSRQELSNSRKTLKHCRKTTYGWTIQDSNL